MYQQPTKKKKEKKESRFKHREVFEIQNRNSKKEEYRNGTDNFKNSVTVTQNNTAS